MKNLIILVFVTATINSLGQGVIGFEKTTHDFGEVAEEDGPIKYQFIFKNTGDQPVKITGVKASCGCTTPGWTKELVMPGAEGFITAQYNPTNRPGQFKKSLRITSNAQNSYETLFIEGYVKPKPKSIEDELPTRLGALRIKYKSLNMGKITNEKPYSKTFDVYNGADQGMSIVEERTIKPDHLKISLVPDEIPSEERGEILLVYDPEKKGDLGFQSDNIRFYTSDAPDEMKEIYVVSTVEEYFPPMSEEEKATAPRLAIDKTNHDFGRVTVGTTVETIFTITNKGKKTLNIRETRPNCDCIISKLGNNDIESGESTTLTVSFDSSQRRARQFKTVTIFSNDPIAPTQMISIRAEVVQ